MLFQYYTVSTMPSQYYNAFYLKQRDAARCVSD